MTDTELTKMLRSSANRVVTYAADRIEALTAERDRYRKALEGLMVHEPDYSDTLWQDAREALNGETP